MEQPDAKRLKLSNETESNVVSSYGHVLEMVSDCLTKDNVESLATVGNLTLNEKDQIVSSSRNGSRLLFTLLEQKLIISESDLSWLRRNLRSIGNEKAAKVIDQYISETEEEFELPSEPEYSDDEDEDDETTTFEIFLTKVGLKDKCPGKLKLKTFLQLGGNEERNYARIFWQRLTTLNYRAGILQELVLQDYSMRDFIFCLLHCCDDFLRQDILEKMSACQLAVPVLLQGLTHSKPTFLLWALRRVMKKWRGESDTFAIEQPIISYPVLNISFLRIGDVRLSKSQLLNTMLSYSQGYSAHTFFLNREQDFVVPKFSPGSVECVWFLPMRESDNQILKEVTAFYNLRGDCTKYLSQTTFICKAAQLTVALIATSKHKHYKHCINEIRKNSKSTLFISVSDEESRTTTSQKVHRPKYKDGCFFVNVVQMDILSKAVCEEIVESCKSLSSAKKCLASFTRFCDDNIQTDEQNEDCKKARNAVCEIFEQGKDPKHSPVDVLEFKKSSFPLQADWKDWVEIDKTSLNIETEVNESFEHQIESKTLKKREKRNSQVKKNLSQTMEVFLRIMKESKSNSSLLQYIFGFMHEKIYHIVNESTRNDMNDIVELEREMRQLRDQMAVLDGTDTGSKFDKQGKPKHRYESLYQNKVDARNKLYKNCRAKNLGGEHFLRELGQLYEACVDLQGADINQSEVASTSNVALLPSLAANLVTEMQSLEIMDGDTGCVPLTWITSVLDNLTMKLNDPKVLVLSVIGVQSSGKSTLLNSMFGVRFPVRAGRCTRGLFIQLLQMSDKLSEELGFEYLVVVDSEGIRSMDHDDRRFDNELVTLALSMANVTIFNIEGENVGPDMTGILQIVAHALMRMKEVDLTCHCRIVQQRVSDMTAADRNKANTKKIKETLDEATRFAAAEEGLEGRYQQFSDVVDLQVDEDLQYVPCLWAGGMAPPNHMYSETVTKIRVKLFEDVKKGSIIPELTLSTFTDRLRDVWKAIKEEGFIFNFQDSVKAVDFNQFCLEYNQWMAQMRQEVHIKVSKMIFTVLADPEKEKLEPDIQTLKESLESEIEDQRSKLTKCIEDYITKHPRKNMMLRYKQEFLHDVSVVLKETTACSLSKIGDEFEVKKISLNLPLFQKKSRLLATLEAKANKAQVRYMDVLAISAFLNTFWQNCLEKIKKENNITKTILTPSSIENVCEKLLVKVTRDMAVGSEIQALMAQEGGIKNHLLLEDCSKYISRKVVKSWLRNETSQKVGPSEKAFVDGRLQMGGQKVPFISFAEIPTFLMRWKTELFTIPDIEDIILFKDEEEQMKYKRNKAVRYLQHIVANNLEELKKQSKAFDTNIFQLMLQKTLKKLSTKDSALNIKLPQLLIAKGLLHFCGMSFLHLCDMGSNGIEHLLDFNQFAVINPSRICLPSECNEHKEAADFIRYYAEKILHDKVESFCKGFYERVDYREYTQALHVPWDLLSFWLTKEDWAHFGHEISFYDLSSIADFYLQEEAERCRSQIVANLSNEVHSFVVSLTSTVFDVQSQGSTWKDWTYSTGESLGCPFIKEAGSIFEVRDIAKVAKMITKGLTTDIEKYFEVHCFDGPDLSLLKIAAGLSFVCNESCPMCGVCCDNILESHTVHSSSLHRPRVMQNALSHSTVYAFFNAISSYTSEEWKIKDYLSSMGLENCNRSILSDTATFMYEDQTHLCKDFKDLFPNWYIHPRSESVPGELLGQFMVAKVFGSFLSIPQSWREITCEHVLQNLKQAKLAQLRHRQSIATLPLKKRLVPPLNKSN